MMMDILTQADLDQLTQSSANTLYISIYMPTIRMGDQTEQNPIRLKNLLHEAESQLHSFDLRSTEIRDMLQPARNLVNKDPFWQDQSDGLAIFITSEQFLTFRLPLNFEKLVMVGTRFNIRPLLPLINELHNHFYVLTLAQGNVNLFSGTSSYLQKLDIPALPADLDDALWYEDPERQLQHHVSETGGEAIHHGHGVDTDEVEKQRLLQYLREVDSVVTAFLDGEQAPLIIVGLDVVQALYEQANTYPRLAQTPVAVHPSSLSEEELHHKVWEIMEKELENNQQRAVTTYGNLSDHDQTIDTIEDIMPAAHHGRIDALLVSEGAEVWGTFDVETERVERQATNKPENEDLINEAAIYTLNKGGDVFVLSPDQQLVEHQAGVHAVLRY